MLCTPPAPAQHFSRYVSVCRKYMLLTNPFVLGTPAFVHIIWASWHVLRPAATSLKAVSMPPTFCQLVKQDVGVIPPAVNWSCPQMRHALSLSMSGEPGSVHRRCARSVATLSEIAPCLNECCVCHGSICDAYLQGRPGVARPSKVRTKNIGRKECQESWRKYVDRSDGSSWESRRIGGAGQITLFDELNWPAKSKAQFLVCIRTKHISQGQWVKSALFGVWPNHKTPEESRNHGTGQMQSGSWWCAWD